MYHQMIEQLSKAGYPTNFEEPFFWPEYTKHAAGTTNRYQALKDADGNLYVDFDTGMMESFMEKLGSYDIQLQA